MLDLYWNVDLKKCRIAMNPEYKYTPPSLRQKRQPFEKQYKGKQVMPDLVQKLSLKMCHLTKQNEKSTRYDLNARALIKYKPLFLEG